MFQVIENKIQDVKENITKIYIEKYHTYIYIIAYSTTEDIKPYRYDIKDYRMQEAFWLDKDIREEILNHVKLHYI
ncbi:MAG: hypothetical protein ACO27Q_09245 [Bacteroidia bacterium]